MKRVKYWPSGKKGLWYYNILDEHGRIRFTTEGYISKQKCLIEIKSQFSSFDNYDIIELAPQLHTTSKLIPDFSTQTKNIYNHHPTTTQGCLCFQESPLL